MVRNGCVSVSWVGKKGRGLWTYAGADKSCGGGEKSQRRDSFGDEECLCYHVNIEEVGLEARSEMHTISCAIIPPMLTPVTCNCLFSVHPR